METNLKQLKIDLPQKALHIQREIGRNAITQAQAQEECAYWLINSFSTLKPKSVSTEPHYYKELRLIEHSDKTPDKKALAMSSLCEQFPQLAEYKKERASVIAYNRGRREMLKKLILYIPKADLINREKYEKKIFDFEISLRKYYAEQSK